MQPEWSPASITEPRTCSERPRAHDKQSKAAQGHARSVCNGPSHHIRKVLPKAARLARAAPQF